MKVSTDEIVLHLKQFKAQPTLAFYATDSRVYSVLRDGYLDRNLHLTPAAYRLLHDHPKGMTNE